MQMRHASAAIVFLALVTASAHAQTAVAAPSAPSAPSSPSAPAAPEATVAAKTEPVRNISKWNLPKRGEKIAIKGYDPVAYFPEGGGTATKGSKEFSAEHKGVLYRFATAANRDLFLANPARYEPAPGGWCSCAMRENDTVDVNPKAFVVKEDRLFLFYDGFGGDTRAKWLKTDPNASATTADTAWKTLSGEDKHATPAAEAKSGG